MRMIAASLDIISLPWTRRRSSCRKRAEFFWLTESRFSGLGAGTMGGDEKLKAESGGFGVGSKELVNRIAFFRNLGPSGGGVGGGVGHRFGAGCLVGSHGIAG
jgi:hypothetical protein